MSNKTKKLLALFFIISFFSLSGVSRAQETGYKLLAPLPGYVETVDGKTTASSYISGIFTLTIAIAGALAVLKIVFSGIQYMSTDAFSGKSAAKEGIQSALWGLLLAISAWLILSTINPDLVKFNLNIPRADTGSIEVDGGG